MEDAEQTLVIPVADVKAAFDERERAQIIHALFYEKHHSKAGVPGHGQFMLIAKLCRLLGMKVVVS